MANVPTTAWSELTPAGSDNVSAGDNRIREMKTQIREVIDVDHDFPSSGQAADVGQHKKVTLQEQANLGTGAEGVPILGAQTVDGKAELVFTDEDDNDVQITKGGVLAFLNTANKEALINLIYPVGTVLTFGVSTNPATLLGFGTWTAIKGKVIVGIDATQTEFDTLNETGGAKTVTLTAAQSGLPAHTHVVPAQEGYAAGTGYLGGRSNVSGSWNASASANTTADASEAHTNLQPYIVKYVWERVS